MAGLVNQVDNTRVVMEGLPHLRLPFLLPFDLIVGRAGSVEKNRTVIFLVYHSRVLIGTDVRLSLLFLRSLLHTCLYYEVVNGKKGYGSTLTRDFSY